MSDRCPTCGSDKRDQLLDGCSLVLGATKYDPWHDQPTPAPLPTYGRCPKCGALGWHLQFLKPTPAPLSREVEAALDRLVTGSYNGQSIPKQETIDCAATLRTALTEARTNSMNPPPWWKWENTDRTTNSGKMLFRCNTCGIEQPTTDKWEYHADACYAEIHRLLTEARTENERMAARIAELVQQVARGATKEAPDGRE